MELRVLEYFLAVAREQNITAAAEALHMSQPALSTQLKNGKGAWQAATRPWRKRLPQGGFNRGRHDSA